MPTLFEYLGIIIMFFSDEHMPIHVHANYNKYHVKVLFHLSGGRITKIEYKQVGNKPVLPPAKQKDLEELIEKYKDEIVKKWIDFFVLNKPVKAKKITKKL